MDLFSRDLPSLSSFSTPSAGHVPSLPSPRRSLPYSPQTPRQPLVLPGHHDPARRITPPENEAPEIPAKEPRPTATSTATSLSPYDKARAYLRQYETAKGDRFRLEDFERPLAIQMSLRDLAQFDLDPERDASYPRFSFDASTSTLIIQCMPSPIHQSISSILNEKIIASKALNVPATLQDQTNIVFEQDFNQFKGAWTYSMKRPDLGIQVQNADGELELRWVLEVGFAETYEQLMADVQLWLEGSSQVSTVTIVRFLESPRYRCPFPMFNEDMEELDPLEVLGISDITTMRAKDVVLEGQYGPATFKGLQWVQQIAEVAMETWVRDADGKAVQRGSSEDLLQAQQVQLDLGDVLPEGYPPIITIDLDQFRANLQRHIRNMVVLRCRLAARDYRKRHGEE